MSLYCRAASFIHTCSSAWEPQVTPASQWPSGARCVFGWLSYTVSARTRLGWQRRVDKKMVDWQNRASDDGRKAWISPFACLSGRCRQVSSISLWNEHISKHIDAYNILYQYVSCYMTWNITKKQNVMTKTQYNLQTTTEGSKMNIEVENN